MGIHKKKFKDLKTFPEWLKWKQEDKKVDRVIVVSMLLILIPLLTFLLGFGEGFNTTYGVPEEVACSAVGMEYIKDGLTDYCVDEQGNFHEIIISNRKAYIENNPQGGKVNEGI